VAREDNHDINLSMLFNYNVCQKATKQIFDLRKLKFILNRNNLNKIYVTYILPLLEYACELWDGCCSRDADNLDHLQFEAARIITGLPRNFYTLKPVGRL
jgi:hypothetical protein